MTKVDHAIDQTEGLLEETHAAVLRAEVLRQRDEIATLKAGRADLADLIRKRYPRMLERGNPLYDSVLAEAVDAKIGWCVWGETTNGDDSLWSTTCQHEWEFSNDGGPIENEIGFCPFCGGRIEVEDAALRSTKEAP